MKIILFNILMKMKRVSLSKVQLFVPNLSFGYLQNEGGSILLLSWNTVTSMRNYRMCVNLNEWVPLSGVWRNVYWEAVIIQQGCRWWNRCHPWPINFQSSPTLLSKSDEFYLLNLPFYWAFLYYGLPCHLLAGCHDSGRFYHPAPCSL